jgi:hypothetical protein
MIVGFILLRPEMQGRESRIIDDRRPPEATSQEMRKRLIGMYFLIKRKSTRNSRETLFSRSSLSGWFVVGLLFFTSIREIESFVPVVLAFHREEAQIAWTFRNWLTQEWTRQSLVERRCDVVVHDDVERGLMTGELFVCGRPLALTVVVSIVKL